MKKIVRGNDCTLKIPVKKMVDGQLETFPLPACTDVVVNLVTAIRRHPLSYTIDTTHDHILLASVKGGTMPLAKMALEVKGKMFDCEWRSNEYEQIEFVDNNASGDTAFSTDDEDEGEQSVEMDTAVVVLAPSADLTLLIKQAEEAVSTIKSETATCTEAEASRQASETARQSAEEGRVGAEAARVSAEQTREAREAERQTAETLRQAAEQSRNDSEQARQTAEQSRTDSETLRKANEQSRLESETTRAQSEATRAGSEANRATAEALRSSSETDRTLSEQSRQEAEQTRQSSETARAKAETLRTDAESARQQAETLRADNETRRQAAETQREADMKKAVDEAVAKAKVSVSYLPDEGALAIVTEE
jgi:hypothetical protein